MAAHGMSLAQCYGTLCASLSICAHGKCFHPWAKAIFRQILYAHEAANVKHLDKQGSHVNKMSFKIPFSQNTNLRHHFLKGYVYSVLCRGCSEIKNQHIICAQCFLHKPAPIPVFDGSEKSQCFKLSI